MRVFNIVILLSILALPGQADPLPIHSDQPLNPPVTWQLEELWRIGGEDDDHVFGTMIAAACDQEGNVFLLDQQLSRVTMVSPTGEYLAELGGEGEGPGECRMPQTFTLLPDGTVGLGQRFPGRFIKVDKQGNPAGRLELGTKAEDQTGMTMLISAQCRGGTFLVGSIRQVPDAGGQSRDTYLQRVSPAGEILATFAEASTYLDFGKPHFREVDMVPPFMLAQAVGPDGRSYLPSDRDEYRIEIWSPDGALDRVITRRWDNPDRPERTVERMNALFEEQDRQLPFRITWEVARHDPAIGEMIVTQDNQLVVASSRTFLDLPDEVFCRYDVFAADGRWSHQLDIQARGNRLHDGLIWLDDGRILMVKGLQMARLTASGNGGSVTEEDDAAEVMEIICCRPVAAR
jgi:hypothetical protein